MLNRELLADAMSEISDGHICEAARYEARPKRQIWRRAATLAACAALVAALALPRQSQGQPSSDAPAEPVYSTGVTIRPLKEAPEDAGTGSSACLARLEPEEILAFDTWIFRGVVRNLTYYEIRGAVDLYATVAAVEITDVIRGNLDIGDIYNVYLPVIAGVSSNSIAGTLEDVAIGSEAIFMPFPATPETAFTLGGSSFCYADVAECWFSEGTRFLFLATDEGVSYDASTYTITPADGETVTLDDAAEYLRSMLG